MSVLKSRVSIYYHREWICCLYRRKAWYHPNRNFLSYKFLYCLILVAMEQWPKFKDPETLCWCLLETFSWFFLGYYCWSQASWTKIEIGENWLGSCQSLQIMTLIDLSTLAASCLVGEYSKVPNAWTFFTCRITRIVIGRFLFRRLAHKLLFHQIWFPSPLPMCLVLGRP